MNHPESTEAMTLPPALDSALPSLVPERKAACFARFARCARFLHSRRPEWCLIHVLPTRVRLFCGKPIVVTIEDGRVWLATDARSDPSWADKLACFQWHEPGKDGPYSSYKNPPSRNGWYDPNDDPHWLEWPVVEAQHQAWIEWAVRKGRAPDQRSVRAHRDDVLSELLKLERADLPATREATTSRVRTLASVLARPEQGRFRSDLMAAHGGACLVSGCRVPAALEAAHIVPVADGGSDRVANGVLLRADLHRLFDAGLLTIDPETSTVSLLGSATDRGYDDFDGREVQLTEAVRAALRQRDGLRDR